MVLKIFVSSFITNGQVLLLVIDFIMPGPELQPGFVLLIKLRSFGGLYSPNPTQSLYQPNYFSARPFKKIFFAWVFTQFMPGIRFFSG